MGKTGTPGAGSPTSAMGNGAANGTTNGAVEAALPGDPAALEDFIAQRRARLAATVDELLRRAQPKELARRGGRGVTARLQAATHAADGRLRIERVGAVAAAGVTLLALIIWRRRAR